MELTDLRDFLEILEEYGELQRVQSEVDWNLEMGAITRRCYDLGLRPRCSKTYEVIQKDTELLVHRSEPADIRSIPYLRVLRLR